MEIQVRRPKGRRHPPLLIDQQVNPASPGGVFFAPQNPAGAGTAKGPGFADDNHRALADNNS